VPVSDLTHDLGGLDLASQKIPESEGRYADSREDEEGRVIVCPMRQGRRRVEDKEVVVRVDNRSLPAPFFS
jgi:hypothetical protein